MVYRLVTGNTIDQRIVERAASKRRLEKMIIHKGELQSVITSESLLSRHWTHGIRNIVSTCNPNHVGFTYCPTIGIVVHTPQDVGKILD